jgi:chlorobactene glucosyltransferase
MKSVNVFELLSGIALLWHMANFAVIFKNWKSFRKLSSFIPEKTVNRLSILIPARNEEGNIDKLLDSIAQQHLLPFEVLVADDHSTDGTAAQAATFMGKVPGLRIITPPERPPNWKGKNWACHVLSEQAQGTHLLFLDADVTLAPGALQELSGALSSGAGMITVWPWQILTHFWEKAALTTMYFSLLAFLPAEYSFRKPRWMPGFLYQRFKPMFAAACGQFLCFEKSVYQRAGGHRAVSNEIVEDVALARRVLSSGDSVLMLNGTGSVFCKMYDSDASLFQGLRKNFFAGFGYHYAPFLLMGLLHLWAYFLAPIVAYLFLPGIGPWIAALLVGLIVMNRIILLRMYQQPTVWALLAWPGILWYQRLALTCMADQLLKREVSWKNRFYQR